MEESFLLNWNAFTENIQNGFRSLYQQDDILSDCTIACEGKLLKAHKVVLSLCSPFFQKMFILNPHPKPIIILSSPNMKFKLVSNLLEFVYCGSVNVEQSELEDFMSIAEALKIKGLSNNSKDLLEKVKEAEKDNSDKTAETKSGIKRKLEADEVFEESKFNDASLTSDITDLTKDDDEGFQMLPLPEISTVELKYDNPKNRESSNPQYNIKISSAQSLNRFGSYDFNSPIHDTQMKMLNEVPNEVNESGSGITMLSSTSLLHGNCVFNRNNTVATQAGLKTYWLCKSYRISMCKARCITFKGKVISATGIHNHLPHMSNKPPEIPPGHTPNNFNPPPPEFHSSSNMLLPPPQHLQQQPNYMQIPHMEASTSETSHFKMEHI